MQLPRTGSEVTDLPTVGTAGAGAVPVDHRPDAGDPLDRAPHTVPSPPEDRRR